MKSTKIVTIGNSHLIRIPRILLDQAGLEEDIELSVEDGKLIIRSLHPPRQGWAEQFAAMAVRGDDQLPDPSVVNTWDQTEWEW